MSLDEQVAIVTGSGRGIGKAVVQRFAQEGAKTVVNYVHLAGSTNQEDAETVAEQIRNQGGEALAIQADVTQPDQVAAMVDQVLNQWKRIDVLVNNAGISFRYPFLSDTLSATENIIDVNLYGTIHCCKAVVPQMVQQGYGRIINITSIAAQVGCSTGYAYAASKGGIIALGRALAIEFAKTGVTINTIAPGTIGTKKVLGYDPDQLAAWKEMVPMKRFGTLEECVHGILFLASKDASYITGQVLSINGGQYLSG